MDENRSYPSEDLDERSVGSVPLSVRFAGELGFCIKLSAKIYISSFFSFPKTLSP